ALRLPGEGLMAFIESHLLTLVTFLPVLGAVLIALLPRGEGGQHKGIAFLFSLLTFVLSIALWTGFRAAPGRYAFEQRTEWAPALGFSYHVGRDGLPLPLFLLTTFLGPIVVLSSWNFIQERVNVYCIALLLLETAILGTLASLDLVLFYVFWEAMLIPMYLLIGMWGSDRRIYAAVKFFLFTFIGSVLMLLAIFWLWSNSGRKSFDYADLLNAGVVDVSTQRWLFLAFALAFAIKVLLWPLHTWLPDAHTEAPEAVVRAVLPTVDHCISTGALCRMVGYLCERTHTRDLAAYGGLATVAPAIAATFLVITLSSIGLPGTNGFVGEFLVLIGTFTSRALAGAVPLAVIGASGVILGAVYMLWVYQRVFFG